MDEDAIKVYYYENVKLFCQNLVDIALKRGRYVGLSKKQHLILKIVIAVYESCFSFIFFSDLHLIIGKLYLDQIQLGDVGSTSSTPIHFEVLLIYHQVPQLALPLINSNQKLVF